MTIRDSKIQEYPIGWDTYDISTLFIRVGTNVNFGEYITYNTWKIPVGMFILVSTIIFIGQALVDKDNWYFVTKIVLTYCEKKMFWWSKKKLNSRLKAENLQKIFRPLEQLGRQLEKNYWDLETCRKS